VRIVAGGQNETAPRVEPRSGQQNDVAIRSYPELVQSSSQVLLAEARAILRDLLRQAYQAYLEDPARGGPDHLIAHFAWQRRRRDAFEVFRRRLEAIRELEATAS
jgi:hypothetical protein